MVEGVVVGVVGVEVAPQGIEPGPGLLQLRVEIVEGRQIVIELVLQVVDLVVQVPVVLPDGVDGILSVVPLVGQVVELVRQAIQSRRLVVQSVLNRLDLVVAVLNILGGVGPDVQRLLVGGVQISVLLEGVRKFSLEPRDFVGGVVIGSLGGSQRGGVVLKGSLSLRDLPPELGDGVSGRADRALGPVDGLVEGSDVGVDCVELLLGAVQSRSSVVGLALELVDAVVEVLQVLVRLVDIRLDVGDVVVALGDVGVGLGNRVGYVRQRLVGIVGVLKSLV